MDILAIDPGPEQSAWVTLQHDTVCAGRKEDNAMVLSRVHQWRDIVAVEMIASYGRPVGAEVFDTCRWIGRFEQAASLAPCTSLHLCYRRDICAYLCGSAHGVNNAVIRQRLIDLYGPGKDKAIGTKKHPGPLYGVKRDVWQALAVGRYALHMFRGEQHEPV